jgi:hypothetical protein
MAARPSAVSPSLTRGPMVTLTDPVFLTRTGA